MFLSYAALLPVFGWVNNSSIKNIVRHNLFHCFCRLRALRVDSGSVNLLSPPPRKADDEILRLIEAAMNWSSTRRDDTWELKTAPPGQGMSPATTQVLPCMSTSAQSLGSRTVWGKKCFEVLNSYFFLLQRIEKKKRHLLLFNFLYWTVEDTYIYKRIYDIFPHSQYITVNTWTHRGFWATCSFPPASSLTAGSLRCCVARCLWNKSCKTHSDTWHLLSQWPGEGNYDRPSTCTADWPLLMKPRPNLHIFEFQNAVKCWSDGGAKSQTSQHTKTVLRVAKRFSKDLRWSHCETGRLLEQRPQGHHGLSPIVPFFYDVPPLGGVWGILRPGRWSHHGVNRCWWCMRDITSTSKPPALLSYFSQGGAERRYAKDWMVVR